MPRLHLHSWRCECVIAAPELAKTCIRPIDWLSPDPCQYPVAISRHDSCSRNQRARIPIDTLVLRLLQARPHLHSWRCECGIVAPELAKTCIRPMDWLSPDPCQYPVAISRHDSCSRNQRARIQIDTLVLRVGASPHLNGDAKLRQQHSRTGDTWEYCLAESTILKRFAPRQAYSQEAPRIIIDLVLRELLGRRGHTPIHTDSAHRNQCCWRHNVRVADVRHTCWLISAQPKLLAD
jgi:hypothetical protein